MITPEQAQALVRRTFAAHGKTPADVVIEEYVDAIRTARCEACAFKAFDTVRTEGRSMPSAPAMRAQIRELGSSVEHGRHLGQSGREVDAGEIERFWRRDAVHVIRSHTGGDDLAAGIVAAIMWSAGMPAEISVVRDEFADPNVRRMWLSTVAANVTEERLEHAFNLARAGAVRPVGEWSDAEWEEAVRA